MRDTGANTHQGVFALGARVICGAASRQDMNACSINRRHKILCFRGAEWAHNYRYSAKSLKTLTHAKDGI